MKSPALKPVKELASKLSPEDRQKLFQFLAELPDSAIQITVMQSAPALSPEEQHKFDEAAKTDDVYLIANESCAAVFQRGRLVFQLVFYAENFLRSRMEIQSWKDAPATQFMKSEIQRALDLMNKTEVTEEEIAAQCKAELRRLFEAQAVGLSKDISAMLPTFAWLLSEGGITIADMGNRNSFAESKGQRKRTLEEMVKILEPFWRRIKDLLNLKPGGRLNVRHNWTTTDYLCLEIHNERLKPVWKEAKRIARQAQKSKEPRRRARWKEAVAETYRAEDLPEDLIEHLISPGDWPPGDLALTHAGRLCLPNVSPPYSLKKLKESLKYSAAKKSAAKRTSPKTSKNKGSS